jgi:hypothetical protein
MTVIDNKVLEVMVFYDSPEGMAFWKKNKTEKGMDWEDNVINLILKVSDRQDSVMAYSASRVLSEELRWFGFQLPDRILRHYTSGSSFGRGFRLYAP